MGSLAWWTGGQRGPDLTPEGGEREGKYKEELHVQMCVLIVHTQPNSYVDMCSVG